MRARWIISAILVILPAGSPSAQQSHLDTRYQIEQMAATFAEHYNKQDAAALASMFTKDALRVSSDGTAVSAGPQAIEESFNTQFKAGLARIELVVDQVSPLGADAAVTIGRYQLTGQGRSGPLKMDGHWSEVEVREGGVWKIRLLTVTPKTAPNAVTPSTGANAARPESNSAGAGTAGVLINIDKTNQTMTVSVEGVETYEWSVSTGKAGYSTPSGTYPATSMNEIWYSKQWDNAPMPHSIFFMKDGHAIHGSLDVKNLGKPVSHGCVRISPENAAMLYALVDKNGSENTQVVLTGVTPGGEFKSAKGHANPRRGFFGRSFGAPYYNGPQAYYGSPWSLSRWLSKRGEQDSLRAILRETPSGEFKFRRGGRPGNRQPLSKQFDGNVAEEAYRANRSYQCES